MSKTTTVNKSIRYVLFSSMLVVLGTWFYLGSMDSTFEVLLGVCGLIILMLALFFHLKWYYYVLILLIPLSIESVLVGDAKLSFPSEALLVIFLPILFLFSKEYWKTVNKILRHPLTVLLVFDLCVEIITSLTSTHIDVSLKRVVIRFLFISGFFVVVNMFTSTKSLVAPWIIYAIGLIPVMYFTFGKHVDFAFNPKVVFSICQPYYTDHTLYGACLAFIIPILIILVTKWKLFAFSRMMQIGLFLVLLMVSTSEILAISRASLLSLLVALLFYGLLYLKISFRGMLIGLVMLGCTLYVVKDPIYKYIEQNEAVSNDGELINHFSSITNVQTDASNLERINRWVCAIRMFETKPFLGYGPGTYQFEYNKFQTLVNKTYISTNSGDKGNAHSEFLTYLSETGLFGFIIFLLTVFGSVYYGMQNHQFVKDPLLHALNLGVLLGLVSFYFHGLFNSFIDQSKMSFLYFTALGTIVYINQKLKAEKAMQ